MTTRSPLGTEPIATLELPTRTHNALLRAGIPTIGRLLKQTEADLAVLPNIGPKGIDAVVVALRERGLELKRGGRTRDGRRA